MLTLFFFFISVFLCSLRVYDYAKDKEPADIGFAVTYAFLALLFLSDLLADKFVLVLKAMD